MWQMCVHICSLEKSAEFCGLCAKAMVQFNKMSPRSKEEEVEWLRWGKVTKQPQACLRGSGSSAFPIPAVGTTTARGYQLSD